MLELIKPLNYRGWRTSTSIPTELPEEIEKQMETAWGNLSHRTLEALTLGDYRFWDVSAGPVTEVLQLSVWETEEFLKAHEAYLHYPCKDLRRSHSAYRN